MLDLRVPAIVHLEMPRTKHFATWRGSADGRVMLGDPSRGAVNDPVVQFAGEWSGYALVVGRPGERPPELERAVIRARANTTRGATVTTTLHRARALQ